MKVDIYVDGAYNPVTKEYGSGVVLLSGGKVIHEMSIPGPVPQLSKYHNVAGEVIAATVAFQMIEKLDIPDIEVDMYYDYAGIELWATGKWTARNSMSQEYQNYVGNLKFPIRFHKVTAHKGVIYNERADTLARRAAGLST